MYTANKRNASKSYYKMWSPVSHFSQTRQSFRASSVCVTVTIYKCAPPNGPPSKLVIKLERKYMHCKNQCISKYLLVHYNEFSNVVVVVDIYLLFNLRFVVLHSIRVTRLT